MPRCEAAPVRWKGRNAFHLSNGTVEITVLLGGGHIADFRLCNSLHNLVFESPWPTIEPHEFSPQRDSKLYGEGPAGRFLSGYTGHAFVLGYFGMPTSDEAAEGLPLHGEAASSQWKVVSSAADDQQAVLSLQVLLPAYQLRAERTLRLSYGASSVWIEEHVTNVGKQHSDFQWVEHAAFGEPLFAGHEARLFLSVTRGQTWPLGYEGHELLPSNVEFRWPRTYATNGDALDLSMAFPRTGTGFVAGLLADPTRESAFIAVHNCRLKLAAGYLFDRRQFPWIALWEENQARDYAPWNSLTRACGVEFGTSPMPLGLQQARDTKTLFGHPVFATIAAKQTIKTAYHLFATAVSGDWSEITDVEQGANELILKGTGDQALRVLASSPSDY